MLSCRSRWHCSTSSGFSARIAIGAAHGAAKPPARRAATAHSVVKKAGHTFSSGVDEERPLFQPVRYKVLQLFLMLLLLLRRVHHVRYLRYRSAPAP